MRKIYIFLLVLMPTLMYSQNNDSASHYTPREIKTLESFEELVKPGHQFFAIALMPFNYYNYSDEISTGESLAGFLGFNAAYYLGHSDGRFLKFGFGVSGMTENTMIFGKSFTYEKQLTDFQLTISENIAYKDLVVSFGLTYNLTKYRYYYQYYTSYSSSTKRYRIGSLGPIVGMQYCFFDNFAVEMQMIYSAIHLASNSSDRDYQFSLNLGINYKIPFQKPKLKFIDGQYIEE